MNSFMYKKHFTEPKLDVKLKSYKVLKIGIFIMKMLIVNLVVYCPTNLTLNDIQISEYDITNEIGESSYKEV